jgi:predicted site-specific integrase-resolvase
MSLIQVSEASKLVKKSIPTIYRHIKQGKISAQIDNDGNKVVDISELQRFYRTVDNHDNEVVSQRESNDSHERITDLTRHIRNLEETVSDLRTRLDKSENERGLVLRLLSDQRADDPPKKKKAKGKKKGKKKKK